LDILREFVQSVLSVDELSAQIELVTAPTREQFVQSVLSVDELSAQIELVTAPTREQLRLMLEIRMQPVPVVGEFTSQSGHVSTMPTSEQRKLLWDAMDAKTGDQQWVGKMLRRVWKLRVSRMPVYGCIV
jgi:uncharacterized small protein (DUF1192 family)